MRVGRAALGSGLGSQGLWPTGDQGSGGRSPGSSMAQGTVQRFHSCSNKGHKLSSQISTCLFVTLLFWGSEVPSGSPWAAVKVWAGLCPFGRL